MNNKNNICPECFSTRYPDGAYMDCGFRDDNMRHPANALPPGTILKARYIVGRVLGMGGFGIIYKARDLETGTTCAIKEYAPLEICIRPADKLTMDVLPGKDIAEYEAGRNRFREEARVLQKLVGIPEVVDIWDYFEEHQTSYFAMEYLTGANLNHHIRDGSGRLPFDKATGLIIESGLIIDKIHKTAGIVHCDVSPENIYINGDNRVVLIDFGSAARCAARQNTSEVLRLKEKFAPLELYVSNIPLGAYTDVFSLAASYYYALTGVYLPTAVERWRGAAYTPLNRLNLNVPDYVSAAVDRALILNWQERTQSMAEFVSGLVKKAADTLPYLKVVAGPMTGKKWSLPPGANMQVGRSQQVNDIALIKHNDVSNPHFYISFDREKNVFRVTDVSRNGTYINGRRLEKHVVQLVNPASRLALAGGACIIELGFNPDHNI